MPNRRLLLCLLIGILPAADKNPRDQIVDRAGKPMAPAGAQPRRAFQLPAGITLDAALTADDAVAIALWNNTALQADLAALGPALADVRDAELRRNPTIQSLLPIGPKPFEFLLMWPIEDLWQRKKRILAAQQTFDVIGAGLVQNGINLVRDVRLAHADLWLAQARRKALAESAALRLRIAQLTAKRLEAGDASGLDVGLANTDAESAAELAKRAGGDIEIAQARLRAPLGMRADPRPLTARNRDAWPAIGPANELVEAAYSGRPDLRSAELQIEANAYRAKWQRSRIFNLVMPMLSVKEVGSPLRTRVGPGLQMELPIFNRNQGLIARADAEVVQAAWRYAALRDRVEQEVRESIARWDQARLAVQQLRSQVRPALEQSIQQSETIFKNGDASYLNVLESTRLRYDVILREIDAEAAMARSFAELERAIGKKL